MGRRLRANRILGILLIIAALAVNQWTLLLIFPRPDGSISLDSKIVIWIVQLLVLAAGLVLFFKADTREQRKKLLFGAIWVLVMIAMIEIGLQIVNQITHFSAFPTSEFQYERSPYAGKGWAKQLFKESRDYAKQFAQFVCWDALPQDGEFVNIDENGVRATWNPDNYPEAPDTLFVFGGSTTWGWGARDDYTIPSHLSRIFHDVGYSIYVHNYGEEAYTFTQELIQLVVLLREGHRPSYVVFYDGINDVFGSYQSGKPGSIHNVQQIRNRMKSKGLLRVIWERTAGWLQSDCMIYKALGAIATKLSDYRQYQRSASTFGDEEIDELSRGTAAEYVKTLALLDTISANYGFKYSCFWQPTTFSEDSLVGDESTSDPRIHDQVLKRLYRGTCDELIARAPHHFHCITDVLKDRTEAYYIDMCHVSEEANAVIARRIFEILQNNMFPDTAVADLAGPGE
jgi:hypothetical protein